MTDVPSHGAPSSTHQVRLRRRRGLYADCLRSYAGIVAATADDRNLDRVLLRTGSRRAVELLVLHATAGRMRLADLLGHASAPGSSLGSLHSLIGRPIDPAFLVRIARVIALQNQLPDDRPNALLLLRWLHHQVGSGAFRPDSARLFQNLVFEAGGFAEASELAESLQISRLDRLLMQSDLANPHGPAATASTQPWGDLFGRLFKREGLEPPSVVPIEGFDPFDGLQCIARRQIDDGPLVTVIVTSWQPGRGLETAVNSLLAQTWRNLEILIIDDASPAEYVPMLERVSALDARIRLIQLAENGGTYNARNHALRAAQGEFVTGQDSDDWSHPRRIEKQVAALIRNRGLVSTASHALRCDAALVFNSPGTLARRENASSLMFRRQPVLDRVGFYDTTRKGGDTEFMLRIRRVFGERSHRTLEHNLALIRQSRGSLSTAEFRPGWRHPSRAAYRRSYEYWHATASDQSLRMDGELSRPREFPIPARFRVKAESRDPLDIVIADDLRGVQDPSRLRAVLDEVNNALRAGKSVGLLHLRSFTDISFERIDTFWPPFARLMQTGQVREVLSSDEESPRILFIRSPEVAMFLSPREVRLRPRKVVIVAERPVRRGKGVVWFVPEACDRNVREAFGRSPEWRAAPGVEAELRPLLPPGARVGAPYPVVIDMRSWKSPRRRLEGRRPVIGRIAEGLPTDFPRDPAKLLEIYPPSGKVPTRFLGGEAALLEVLGSRPVPKSWTIVPAGSVEPDLFLATCDFFVYFDRGLKDPPRRLIIQALAAGCVVVLPPALAVEFGDAVVPAEPGDVVRLVQELATRADDYRLQVDRGLEFAARMDGASIYGQRGAKQAENAKAVRTEPSMSDRLAAGRVYDSHLGEGELARTARGVDASLLRMNSENGRELLLGPATGGALSMQDLARHLESYRAQIPPSRPLRECVAFDPQFAVRLARVLVLQESSHADTRNGRDLAKWMIELGGAAVMPEKWTKIFFDSAILAGDIGFATYLRRHCRMNAADSGHADTDLLHPRWGCDPDAWLAMMNRLFSGHGIEAIRLGHRDGAGVHFDDIRLQSEVAVREGPLVTIIVTSWKPGRALVSSVRSALSQTWGPTEVLVVDDGSPAKFHGVLRECEAMDPRVKILQLDSNSGTYVARNAGLDAARGEYITFQDSDDLSHPRRVEMQLRPLLESSDLMATKSSALGVDDHLFLAAPGRDVIHGNASSLMIRRSVLPTLGYFDSVRKGADTEFTLRIEAAYRIPIPVVAPEVPLSIVRRTSGSLSRGEFRPGWRHPARTAYREAYSLWHDRIRAGEESPYLPKEHAPRRFQAPKRFAVKPDVRKDQFDMVFLVDLRPCADDGGTTPLPEVEALLAAGLRVGWCQMESIRGSMVARQAVRPSARRALSGLGAEEVICSDAIHARVVACCDPVVLQFTQAGAFSWTADELVVLVSAPPMEPQMPTYSVEDCSRNARALLGREAKWAPRNAAARASITPLLERACLLPFDVPELVSPADQPRRKPGRAGGGPRLGRWFGDSPPAVLAGLLAAYDGFSEVVVTLAASKRAISGVKVHPRPDVQLMPIDAMPLGSDGFLTDLDYYVRFDREQQALFPRDALGAIAMGCIVILPPKYRPMFRDAALYCEEADARGLVRRLNDDEDLRGFVRGRIAAAARSLFGPAAFISAVSQLLGGQALGTEEVR